MNRMDKMMVAANAFAAYNRAAIPEGIVLLEHDGALPLTGGEPVALFGRGQFEYLKSGSGSGGRVNCPYVTNVYDEIRSQVSLDDAVTSFYRDFVQQHPFDEGDGWKPCFCQVEAVPDADLVREAAQKSEKAIYIICRNIGETFDYQKAEGNWYLSREEDATISLLSRHFRHVIVLINSGNIMDMSWVKKYAIGTVAYIWQGGQEGGAGTVDALMGIVAPSGRLTDTIAMTPEDYPCDDCFGDAEQNIHKEDIFVGYRYFETFAKERVLYPFGYGLNYTVFSQECVRAEKQEDHITLSVLVKNTGNFSGKDVVQVYFEAPQATLGKPARQLVAFQKTNTLKPGGAQMITLDINLCDMACYDDCGKSGYPHAWILESGEYRLYIGQNVRDALCQFTVMIDSTRVVKQCVQALAPTVSFDRMINAGGEIAFEKTPVRNDDPTERIKQNLPPSLEITGDKGLCLKDVATENCSLEAFIAQFDEAALCEIVRGEGMSSPKATYPGTASCFGGTTKAWYGKGVPVVTTCDGPSGVRMESGAIATCIPVGALLASAWAPELFEGMYTCLASEMKQYDVDVLLGPGINIHRSGLCGRNFEYFSEDPYLAGTYAAAISKFLTQCGVYATLKHFAVNSQERNRNNEDEILSERAAREIYLKPFEIAVRSGFVRAIMTSYNRVNGVHTSGHYDLTSTILRDDWGYTGIVMTDWGTTIDDPRDHTDNRTNLATMVKAQNDIYMVKSDAVLSEDDLSESLENGYLTLGELQRCAMNLVRFAMETDAFKTDRKSGGELLSSAHRCIYHEVLSEYPLEIRKELDDRYQTVPKRMVCPQPETDGFYCVEILYRLKGNALEQKNIHIYADRSEPIQLIGIVTEQPQKQRFSIFLARDTKLYFEEGVAEVSVFELP